MSNRFWNGRIELLYFQNKTQNYRFKTGKYLKWNLIFCGLERRSVWKESSIIVGHAELGMLLTYSYLSDRHSGRWIICHKNALIWPPTTCNEIYPPPLFQYLKGIFFFLLDAFWQYLVKAVQKQCVTICRWVTSTKRPCEEKSCLTQCITECHHQM